MSDRWTPCDPSFIVIKPVLSPSARRRFVSFPPATQRDASAGPDREIAGMISAAARCVMPASFPMPIRHAGPKAA